jgi:isoquinoline 1-oxidoreductase beta subunit
MKSVVDQGRRSFLKASAGAGGGLIIAFHLPGVAPHAEATVGATKLNSFLKIGTDGKVTFSCGQVEMGQGAHNALAMMIAEELEVDFDNVRIEQGGIDPAFGNPRYSKLPIKAELLST